MKKYIILALSMLPILATAQVVNPRQTGVNAAGDDHLSVIKTFAFPALSANPVSTFNRAGSAYHNTVDDKLYLRNGSTFSPLLGEALAASSYVSLTGSYNNPSWLIALNASKINGLANGQVVYGNAGGVGQTSNLTWDGQLFRIQGTGSNTSFQIYNGDGTANITMSTTTASRLIIGATRVDMTAIAVPTISTLTMANTTSTSNSRMQFTTTGTVVDRNQNDANPVFTVSQLQVSATGHLQDWTNSGIKVFIASNGTINASNNLIITAGATNAHRDMYYRSASGILNPIPIGTSGQLLRVGVGIDPEWATLSAVTSLTPGYGFTSATPITSTGTLTIDTASAIMTRLTGLSKAQGDARFLKLTDSSIYVPKAVPGAGYYTMTGQRRYLNTQYFVGNIRIQSGNPVVFESTGGNTGSLTNNTLTGTRTWSLPDASGTTPVVNTNTAPSSSTDTGKTGEVRVVGGFIYICTATNTWVRAIATTIF